MEHHADDDGDVLMELACTDDFEEHCEPTAESEQEQKNVEDKVCWADESDEPEFRDDRTGRPLHPVKDRAGRGGLGSGERSPLAYNGWTWIRASESTGAGEWRRTSGQSPR